MPEKEQKKKYKEASSYSEGKMSLELVKDKINNMQFRTVFVFGENPVV